MSRGLPAVAAGGTEAAAMSGMKPFIAILLGSLVSSCGTSVPSQAEPPPNADVVLELFMDQDFAGPPEVTFRRAWDSALVAPQDGFLEQFPFVARGFPENTEVRLMLAAPADATGGLEPGDVYVAARRALRGLEIEWFADYGHAGGGVLIRPVGGTGDGIPREHLCKFQLWLEAANGDDILATSTRSWHVRRPEECAQTPTTW